MIPILFEHTAQAFTSHGLGDLMDCGECKAVITDEGEYELTFTYPVGAEMFSELKINRIVVAKVNDYDPVQAFRIYGYEKELNGMITVNCQHISYDLAGYPVKAFGLNNNIKKISSGIAAIQSNALRAYYPLFQINVDNDFNNSATPQNQDKAFKIETPTSVRACLLDGDDSLKSTFGGDLYFNNYDITIKQVGGEDRGVVLEYGVDITDLQLEENISEMITGVVPYWKGRRVASSGSVSGGSSTDEYVYGSIQNAKDKEGHFIHFDRENIVALDLSSYFINQTNAPTPSQLNSKAQEWMLAEHVGEPEINLTVNYAALGQDVRMYDAVKVRFARMGIDVTAKVSSYTYDVLNERCTEIEVSNVAHSSKWKGLEDASRLRKGLIPPQRIADGSISSDKIGDGQVGGGKLGAGAVDGWHLTTGAVNDATKVKNGIIERAKTSTGVQSTLNQVDVNASDISNIINGQVAIRIKGVGYIKKSDNGGLIAVEVPQ